MRYCLLYNRTFSIHSCLKNLSFSTNLYFGWNHLCFFYQAVVKMPSLIMLEVSNISVFTGISLMCQPAVIKHLPPCLYPHQGLSDVPLFNNSAVASSAPLSGELEAIFSPPAFPYTLYPVISSLSLILSFLLFFVRSRLHPQLLSNKSSLRGERFCYSKVMLRWCPDFIHENKDLIWNIIVFSKY